MDSEPVLHVRLSMGQALKVIFEMVYGFVQPELHDCEEPQVVVRPCAVHIAAGRVLNDGNVPVLPFASSEVRRGSVFLLYDSEFLPLPVGESRSLWEHVEQLRVEQRMGSVLGVAEVWMLNELRAELPCGLPDGRKDFAVLNHNVSCCCVATPQTGGSFFQNPSSAIKHLSGVHSLTHLDV